MATASRVSCPLGEAAHHHTVTRSQAAYRVPRASEFRSRCLVGVRVATNSGSAAALQATSARSQTGDGVEEPVGGRQRDMVDEILRGGDGTPVEGGDPARERVDEAVQFGIWSARLTYPYRSAVSPSKSFAPRTISSARPRPTRCGRRSAPPPPGCSPTPTLDIDR